MKTSRQELIQIHAPTWRDVIAVLNPDELSDAAAVAAGELMEAGESANTRRSYEAAWRYWNRWFELRYARPLMLPVAVPTVVQFIVDHAGRLDKAKQLVWELPAAVDEQLVAEGFKAAPGPMAMNTLRHRLSVLSKAHTLCDLDSPVAEGRVRELLRRTGAAHKKRGALPLQKPPLRVDLLQCLLETCDQTPAGVRDRAMLLFAFSSGGRRRSEVTAATFRNVEASGASFTFNLTTSKSNQAGRDLAGNSKPIVGAAADALRAWIKLLRLHGTKVKDLESGPIFRRFHRAGAIGAGLSPGGLNEIVKGRAQLAKEAHKERMKEAGEGHEDPFEKLDWDALSAHSLRSGFVSEAGRLQVPMLEAMAMTGHKTQSAFMTYNREAQLASDAARVFDRGGKGTKKR